MQANESIQKVKHTESKANEGKLKKKSSIKVRK